eukprot:9296571-Pyramimonas_sp.AAC.1
MAHADGQIAVRADDGSFERAPIFPQHPHMYDGYPSAWTSQKQPITEEEARLCMNVLTSLTKDQWVLGPRINAARRASDTRRTT